VVPLDASMVVDEIAEKHGAKLVRGPVGDAKLLREMKRLGANSPANRLAWIHRVTILVQMDHYLDYCSQGF